jgi:hypothetical protein
LAICLPFLIKVPISIGNHIPAKHVAYWRQPAELHGCRNEHPNDRSGHDGGRQPSRKAQDASHCKLAHDLCIGGEKHHQYHHRHCYNAVDDRGPEKCLDLNYTVAPTERVIPALAVGSVSWRRPTDWQSNRLVRPEICVLTEASRRKLTCPTLMSSIRPYCGNCRPRLPK